MNQIFSSVCAAALFTASAYAYPDPCCRSLKAVCYIPEEECIPKPLKKSTGCYDSFREPYRISYPRLCRPLREDVEIGNTPAALRMRQAAVLRQREIVQFERDLLAATPPITQPSTATGTTIYGETEGAGVFDNPNAPIPAAPPYPGPGVCSPRKVRVVPAPVGEIAPVQYLVIAKPVPGKPGYVFCPFVRTAGYVDVTGLAPGSIAKDPYSGRPFRVP